MRRARRNAKFKGEHCQKCADLCRQCATECRKMAA
ncbi:four-helix bundle copper-binding protein [Marinithermofilum abyssi]|nr:four-helix bundle copper-binding protein [Marinithermofilum abyssi]